MNRKKCFIVQSILQGRVCCEFYRVDLNMEEDERENEEWGKALASSVAEGQCTQGQTGRGHRLWPNIVLTVSKYCSVSLSH